MRQIRDRLETDWRQTGDKRDRENDRERKRERERERERTYYQRGGERENRYHSQSFTGTDTLR